MSKKEPIPQKTLFSRIPLGSIFFRQLTHIDIGQYIFATSPSRSASAPPLAPFLEFRVDTELGDLETPTAKYGHDFFNLNNVVVYNDIKKYGFDYCVKHKIYTTINLSYIDNVRKIRNVKTLKELKWLLERRL